MTGVRAIATVLAACILAGTPGTRSLDASALAEASAEPTPISTIVASARETDGKVIRIRGEAIGDIMVRGEHAWVNVLDASGTAIGVFLPKEEALKIRNLGRYLQKGDTVDLTGVFHSSCDTHAGEPDYHAGSLQVVETGHTGDYRIEPARVTLAAVLLALAAIAGLAVHGRALRSAR